MNAILASSTQSKIIGAGLFFVLVFLTGAWVGFSGPPYGTAIITVHKFVSVGAVAFLGMAVYQVNQAARLSAIQLTAFVVTCLLFGGTVASGGLLSTDNPMPAAVLAAHRITPFLTVLSASVTLYLLFGRNGLGDAADVGAPTPSEQRRG